MEIQSVIRLTNQVYHSEVSLGANKLTPAETEAIYNFGAPSVECGGAFGVTGTTGATGTNTYFELAANAKLFPTNFPVKQCFSLLDYPAGSDEPPDAAQRADIWRDAIISRVTTAMRAKRAETISVDVGTTVQTIDTTP